MPTENIAVDKPDKNSSLLEAFILDNHKQDK